MNVLRPAFLDVTSWIEEKTEVKRASMVEKGQENLIRSLYEGLLQKDECVLQKTYVSRSYLIEAIQNEMGISQQTADREIKKLFEKGKIEKLKDGKSVYLKIL
jgi:DNA-binding transcriptional ArsR family regulator